LIAINTERGWYRYSIIYSLIKMNPIPHATFIDENYELIVDRYDISN
jgi:hypothetical protein